jgi:hypothetical protein
MIFDAERDTRWPRRAFISFEELLSNWHTTIARASNGLGISLLPTPAQEAEVEAFLEHDMRHQIAPETTIADDEITQISLEIHAAFVRLSRTAHDANIYDSLDKIGVKFDALPKPTSDYAPA